MSDILKYLYDPDWFDDLNDATLLVRAYSVVGVSKNDFDKVASNAIWEFEDKYPLKILYLEASDMEYKKHFTLIVGDDNGVPVFKTFSQDLILPKAPYIFLSIPYSMVDNEQSQNQVLQLDRIVALFRVFFGNNFLRQLVFQNIVNPNNGKMKALDGSVISVPQSCEGPFAEQKRWLDLGKLVNSFKEISKDIKIRIDKSLEIFEQSSSFPQNSKFFYYWIAIEVLCGRHKPNTIYKQLARYYNNDQGFIRNDLYCEKIYELRNKVFHNGLVLPVHQLLERYMQCMFLDLLLYHSNSDFEGHMAKMLNSAEWIKDCFSPDNFVVIDLDLAEDFND